MLALDRTTGKVAWQHVAREEAPHEGTHHEFGTYVVDDTIYLRGHKYLYAIAGK